MPQRVSPSFQVRRALLRQLAPRYQQASSAQKTLLLNSFVEWSGYTRKYAIALLNHGKHDQQIIQRRRLPQYRQEVQQALFLAWKATHYVCAKRLLPSLPSLVALLEGHGHLQLTEEERRQLLAMSLSTAERLLRTQRKPRLHGLSPTAPGPLRKAQIPVCTFSQWEENRPGFVEMDLVAHCGDHLDGSFLYTLTLTDLATGWTECIPLLDKSADAVLAGLVQARTLFPFPLLGIDTDGGSEFLNGELMVYCEQEQLTFTRGRPAVKNDQCHVEQKNGAVMRKAVGHARLVGVQAYHQLHEVYRALRLVVNYFQPSLKLQAKIPRVDRVRRVHDIAQTPLQRLLASGVLPEDRQRALRERVQQIDPLTLSEQLDALRHTLLCGARLPLAVVVYGQAWQQLRFSFASCTFGSLPTCEQGPERTDHQEVPSSSEEILEESRTPHHPFAGIWEELLALLLANPKWTSPQILQEIGRLAPEGIGSVPRETLMHDLDPIPPPQRASYEEHWPPECNQRGHSKLLPTEPDLSEDAVSAANQYAVQVQSLPIPTPMIMSSTARVYKADHLALTMVEHAIMAYVQEMRATGRTPKTLRWHQTSLSAMLRSLWREFHLRDECFLSGATLRNWLTELSIAPSSRTGAIRAVSTVAAYARSAHAFCNWLVRQGYVPETFFPQDAVPKAQRRLPQAVEPEVFVHLLRACQLPGSPGGQNAGMTARNRAILWLLLDTGLQVSELCSLRISDVDCAGGTVTLCGKRGRLRIFPLSADGQRALGTYLDQARLTPAWEPAVPEARGQLLLTERRHPLTTNSITLLLRRLSQRAGFTMMPICPSMLRDTYAIRFVQAGGGLTALREQLGVADLALVKRYQRCCQQQGQEREAQVCSEGSVFTRQSRQAKSKRRREQGRGRGHRRSS